MSRGCSLENEEVGSRLGSLEEVIAAARGRPDVGGFVDGRGGRGIGLKR